MGRFGKSPEKAHYRESAMREFFPDALVKNYERLIVEMTNHPKDRHVLAAAVACRADFVLTVNLKDFPTHAAIGPSAFLKRLYALDRDAVLERLGEQAAAIDISLQNLLDRLAVSVPGLVSAIGRATM